MVFCLSRYGEMNAGLLLALDKKTGATIFETKLRHYAWSSPVAIYDKAGNMYLFLADSKGYVMLIDGMNGKIIYEKKIAELFEASPVVFDNQVVVPSRPGEVFCFEVN